MLIHRSPPHSTDSIRGSVVSGRTESTRARAERLRRGFGRLGIGSERVVQHVHYPDSTCEAWYPPPLTHSRCIERGGGTWPCEGPATTSRAHARGERCQIHRDVTGRLDKASVTAPAEAYDFERGFTCLSRRFSARNVTRPTRSTPATCASSASGRSKWRTTTRGSTRPRRSGRSRRAPRRSGGTRTSCRSRARRRPAFRSV